jgi:hypothetical protein
MRSGRPKKEIERAYLEEARKASSIFPTGQPIDHEWPRFPHWIIGIEVTELCSEASRAEGRRLAMVPKAKALYTKRGAAPVSVSPVLAPDVATIRVQELASGLAEFVYRHCNEHGTYRWDRCDDLPTGFSQIGIFAPLPLAPEGEWRYFEGFDSPLVQKSMIESRILEKNGRLVD